MQEETKQRRKAEHEDLLTVSILSLIHTTNLSQQGIQLTDKVFNQTAGKFIGFYYLGLAVLFPRRF